MYRYLNIFFFLISLPILAQPYHGIETNNIRIDPQWVNTYKSSGFCWAYDILVDESGHTYEIGMFQKSLVVGDSLISPKCTPGCQETAFLIKRDTTGAISWITYLAGNNRPTAMHFDQEGNIVFTGIQQSASSQFYDAQGKESTLNREGNGEVYLLAVSRDGTLIKSISIPNERRQYPNALGQDDEGNWYIAGNEDFRRPNNPGRVEYKGFLIKLNKKWEIEWVERADTSGSSQFNSLIISGKYVYTGGSYRNSVRLGKIHLQNPKSDQFPLLVQWTKSGKVKWAIEEIGSYPSGVISQVNCDSKGYVYIWAGSSYSYATLAKFDTKGKRLWSINQKGKASVYTEKLRINKKDELFLCGESYGNVFGSTGVNLYSSKTKGGTDPYIACYDIEGILKWIKVYGGKGTDYCKAIAVGENHLYAYGWTNTSFLFFNKNVKTRGNTFYTARFALSDLQLMDSGPNREPEITEEKWPKINEQRCECEEAPNPKLNFVPGMSGLLEYPDFEKFSPWVLKGGATAYKSIFFKDFQSSTGYNDLFYSLKLVSFRPLILMAPDSAFEFALSPCTNAGRYRLTPMTFSYSEPLKHYDRSFDYEKFDSAAASYLELFQYMAQVNDDQLLYNYLFDHPANDFGELLERFKKDYQFKLDPDIKEPEQILAALMPQVEKVKGDVAAFVLDDFILEKAGKHPVTRMETIRLNMVFQFYHLDVTVEKINKLLPPQIRLTFDAPMIRVLFNPTILHPWDPVERKAMTDSLGQIEPGNMLVSTSTFGYTSDDGIGMIIKSMCMQRSEIGNTGMLIHFNNFEMVKSSPYKYGLGYYDFPTLIDAKYRNHIGSFDDPPPVVPILRDFNGIFVNKAELLLQFEGQSLPAQGEHIAINNRFLAGSLYLPATPEREGNDYTGFYTVQLPEGDKRMTGEEIEAEFLKMGFESVLVQPYLERCKVYFVFR